MIQEPTQPTPTPPHEPAPAAAVRRNPGLRIAVVIGLVLLLAVPVVMAMAANSGPSSPNAILGAGATNAPSTDAPASTGKPDNIFKGLEKLKGLFGQGHGGDRGPGKGPITIDSIKGNDLALSTAGWLEAHDHRDVHDDHHQGRSADRGR